MSETELQKSNTQEHGTSLDGSDPAREAPKVTENGDVSGTPTSRKCNLVFTLHDMKDLSKALQIIENVCGVLQHVESRRARGADGHADILVTMETSKDDVSSLVKTLRQNSAICDVTVLSETAASQKEIWFPRHISDLDKCAHLITQFDPDLDSEHPGFADTEYRRRREVIIQIAFNHKQGQPIPYVEHSVDDINTWGVVYRTLKTLYPTRACHEYIRNLRVLELECGYSEHTIPQLEDVSNFLKRRAGWQLRPVAGLLTPRDFLASLAFRVFQCTQYIRHPSKPHWSVEPDCVHELLGHVPMLADAGFAQFSQEIGLASLGASDEDIEKFATLYWFTIEMGLCRQDGGLRAYGASLLTSFGELQHALSDVPEHKEFEPAVTVLQKFKYEEYQTTYFIGESFENIRQRVSQYAAKMKHPVELRYNPYTQSIETLDNFDVISDITRSLGAELATLQKSLACLHATGLA